MNRKPRILVVGSLVLDQIASTSVFPRQGQTVLGTGFRKAPGGKGANQAVQAALLGADVTMIGKLGHDGNGQELLNACMQAGVNTQQMLYDDSASSGCAVIILETLSDGSTQNRIIVISGSNMTITPDDVAFLKEQIAQYDLVMLQLEIPMEINELVAKYAYEKGVPVMLNSAPSAPLSDELLKRLTFISPNETEAEDLTSVRIRKENGQVNRDDVTAAAKVLRDKGVKNVLITLGSSGAALFCDDKAIFSPCVAGTVAVDPTAAGDSFVGAFCVGYSCGWALDDILTFANHAASITVSSMGAMPSLPRLAQVEALLERRKASVPNTAMLK